MGLRYKTVKVNVDDMHGGWTAVGDVMNSFLLEGWDDCEFMGTVGREYRFLLTRETNGKPESKEDYTNLDYTDLFRKCRKLGLVSRREKRETLIKKLREHGLSQTSAKKSDKAS